MKIKKDFYKVSALELAPKLLGLNLVHNTKEGITKGKIVEVEAYMGTKDKVLMHIVEYQLKEPSLCLVKQVILMYI